MFFFFACLWYFVVIVVLSFVGWYVGCTNNSTYLVRSRHAEYIFFPDAFGARKSFAGDDASGGVNICM